MGLTPRFTRSDIRADFMARVARIEAAILTNFQYLGELCVTIGRSTDTYRDQTGNLRSSIGYVIARDGVVIESNFTRTSSPEGANTGRALATSRVADFPTGYVLIVVAGMNYAASVEARGLDVLTSSEQFAETQLPRMLRELKLDIETLR